MKRIIWALAILLDKEAIHRGLEVLDRNAFYKTRHRQIFDVIIDLYERSEEVDLVTVAEELKRRDELEGVGGPVFLQGLVANVTTVANVAHHARIVQEKAILRALIQTSTQITTSAFEAHDTSEE